MSFAVLQLNPSTMESIFPKSPFMYGMGSGFTRDDVRNLLKAGGEDGYRVVAQFNVDTLDEVFEASNRGHREDVIERIESMHSVSVGDVIVDEHEGTWVVAPTGFEMVGKLSDILSA